MSKEKLKEYLQSISKDRVVELCLQYQFDAKIAEQQLAEKGQEINIKNNKLAELKKELTICKDKLKRKTQSNRDLQHRVHNVNTQLAIQELEKVKNKCNGMYELWLYSNYKENMYDNEDIAGVFEDISVFTNDLIKKLKGE